ncbi:MAG: hypothetical protein WCP53_00300 [Verrucomicrobiota bacterium]
MPKPAPHTHALGLTLPAGESEPVPHAAHALAPVALEYVAGGHETHVALAVAAVAVEYVPAGQAAQASSLASALKVPGAQETHAPATRVSPAAQRDNGQIPRRLQSATKPH